MSNEVNIHEFFLSAHRKGVEQAIDLSIRTGTPIVVEKNGKIIKIQPKFKYIRVPIDSETIDHQKQNLL